MDEQTVASTRQEIIASLNLLQAYFQGQSASYWGLTVLENPYKIDSREYAAWHLGYVGVPSVDAVPEAV